MTRPGFEVRSLLLHAALDGELDAAGVIEMERLLPPIRTLRRNTRA